MDEPIASLIDQLREARNREAAAKLDADDTAYQINKLNMEWSERNKLHKAVGEEIARIEDELAQAIHDATIPYLAFDVVSEDEGNGSPI